MMYLAQVDKQRLNRGKLHIVMKRQSDSWISVLPIEFIPLPSDYHHLHEGLLVFVELDEKRQIKSITPALSDLIRILQNMSLRLLKYQKQDEEIKLWRESLEYQSATLTARVEDIDRREELLKIREKQLDCLLKSKLTQSS